MVEIVPPLSGGTLHHFCLDFELDFVSGGGDGQRWWRYFWLMCLFHQIYQTKSIFTVEARSGI